MPETDLLPAPLDEIKPRDDLPIDPAAARIGVLCGCDRNRDLVLDPLSRTHGVGNNDGLFMLRLVEPRLAISRLHITPKYFRQTRVRWNLNRADLIWNVISDIDQNPLTLDVARKMLETTKVPVINPPRLVSMTRRHDLPPRLAGLDGVHAPQCLLPKYPTRERVEKLLKEKDFRFPAILRRTGSHNGEVVGIIDSLDGLEPIFGDRKSEYYLIEFVDVRRGDGLYRKTRFFFVGDEIITRQHIVGDEWSVHGRSSRGAADDDPRFVESAAMLIDGFEALPAATRAAVHAIRERIGLDYCGLDCCLMEDGTVVVFECNATMNFNPRFRNARTQHNRAALPRMVSALSKLVVAKTGIPPAPQP